MFLITALNCAHAQTKNFLDQPYMEVSGIADSLVSPNEIFIKIIVSEKDSKDRIPLETSEEKMIKALQGAGINTAKNLSTGDMLNSYDYYLFKKNGVAKSKEYILKVGDADTASKVFILLEEMDIARTSIYRLSHTDLKEIEYSCRSKAMKDARMKAKALTEPLGQSVGQAIHIADIEPAAGFAPENPRTRPLRSESVNYMSKDMPSKVDFEKIKISCAINVKFLLK